MWEFKQRKSVVLFSGGLDSTTILSSEVAKRGKESVIALSLLYGQKHNKEIGAAREIASYLGVKHIIMDVGEIFQYDEANPLLGKGEIPKGGYETGTPATYIHNRNNLFLNIAASIAMAHEFDIVIFGAHADDIAGAAYPDCSPAFYFAAKEALRIATDGKIEVEAPFIDCHKADIVKRAAEVAAPLDKSWSCYEGGRFHCGECSTCIDRKKAFVEAGYNDPTVYENEEYDVIQVVATGYCGGVFRREWKATVNRTDAIRWLLENPDLPYYITDGNVKSIEVIPYAGKMEAK